MSQFGRAFNDSRTLAAVVAGKAAGTLSRALGRGGGTALPGMVATRLAPDLIRRLANRLEAGSIVVTGTNGKTTMSRMVADIAQAAGYRVVHNRSGSNLVRGLATTLVDSGRITAGGGRLGNTVGVFEVDEATLSEALPDLNARVVVFANLFRDQLDRYGEVDSIAASWRGAVASLPASVTIALNADDPSVASLGSATPAHAVFFGVDDHSREGVPDHAADARWCACCGSALEYAPLYYGHLGIWRCSTCGSSRPRPDYSATRVDRVGERSTSIDLTAPSGTMKIAVSLGGLYNAYNAVAAVTAASEFGISTRSVLDGLQAFRPAFGRQEEFTLYGRSVQVLLCKNPAGANQALRQVRSHPEPVHVMFALNDGIADGRDVSWIWDTDFEILAGHVTHVVASGRRAADMALRLEYGGMLSGGTVEAQIPNALEAALAATPPGGRLWLLPTYTAMLEARAHLGALAHREPFWEQ